MALEIMASVQEQIIGNCLCVLGDAMAMPIGSMIAKFRTELEAEIEAARDRNNLAATDDVLALGVAAQVTGTQNQWWLGPPYSVEALEVTATGNGPVANFDALEQRLLSMLGGRPTVMTRDDNAVNAGGLNWFSTRQGRPLDLIVAPYGGEHPLTTVAQELQHATFLVTGTSPCHITRTSLSRP